MFRCWLLFDGIPEAPFTRSFGRCTRALSFSLWALYPQLQGLQKEVTYTLVTRVYAKVSLILHSSSIEKLLALDGVFFVPFQLSSESVLLFREPVKYFCTDLFCNRGGGCWGYPLADQIYKVVFDGFPAEQKNISFIFYKSCFPHLLLGVERCLFVFVLDSLWRSPALPFQVPRGKTTFSRWNQPTTFAQVMINTDDVDESDCEATFSLSLIMMSMAMMETVRDKGEQILPPDRSKTRHSSLG